MSDRQIAAIAFDKDGTLFDSERLYGEALRLTCRQLGRELTDAFHHGLIGLAAEKTLPKLRAYFGHEFDEAEIIRRWLVNRDQLVEDQGMAMMPGAAQMIRHCYAQGYPLALVTSDSHDGVLHDFSHADADLMGHFSVVITVDDVHQAKPHPEPYLRAAAYLGVEPQTLLVVEDSAYGAQAALDAGCMLALYPGAPVSAELAARAVVVLENMADLAVLL